MAATGRVKAWKTLVEKNNFIPVSWDRQREASDDSAPFAIAIKSVEGVIPKVRAPLLLSESSSGHSLTVTTCLKKKLTAACYSIWGFPPVR